MNGESLALEDLMKLMDDQEGKRLKAKMMVVKVGGQKPDMPEMDDEPEGMPLDHEGKIRELMAKLAKLKAMGPGR